MVNVALPCCVQFVPSGERYPVNALPLRTSLTQQGALRPVVLLLVVVPPVLERVCQVTPLLGVTAIKAFAALAFRLSRIMTPALDQGSMFCTAATRAMMVQFPLTGTQTNWKASAGFQMSAPLPVMEN